MRLLLLIIILATSACLPSQAREPKGDKILDIQQVTSPGGISAWLVEDKSLPIISMTFSFKHAGSIQNTKQQQGLAQLLSNTLDEGAGEMDSQTFQKALSDNSISLSFNSSRDNFSGSLKTLSRHQDKAFDLLRLALNEPRFDPEPLERMRQANIARIKSSKGDPDWKSARLLNDIAYAGHPYSLNSGGTITSLNALTDEDLRNFKNQWLTRDRLVVSVTGNIDPKTLSKALDLIFGPLPKEGMENKVQKHTIQNTGKVFLYKEEIPQTIISAILPSIERNDPDYYAAQVMNMIFGAGGFGSRLMEEAREKQGLTYGIYSSLMFQDYTNALTISTSTKNSTVNNILETIKQQMTKIQSELVSEQELSDAKAYLTGSLILSLTSTDAIANVIQGIQLENFPITYLDTYAENINKVTSTDVQRAAEKLLKPENMAIIMVGQPQGVENATTISEIPNVE